MTESKKMRDPAKTMTDLEARLREPLAETDVRRRNGQEYVSIGDTYFNLSEDFGALGYDVIVTTLEVGKPYGDERDERDNKGKPLIDRETGAVEKRFGWTCYARATVELILHPHLTDVNIEIRKQGVGAHSSEMQPYEAMAYENAAKGAVSDAVKRAAAPLGPRYGLALLFKDDDDRVGMGLIEPPAALVKARAARDAKKNTGQANPTPPGVPGQAAGVLPAAATNAAAFPAAAGSATASKPEPSQVGAASPQPGASTHTTGNVVAGEVAPPVHPSTPAQGLRACDGAADRLPTAQEHAQGYMGPPREAVRGQLQQVEGHGTVYGESTAQSPVAGVGANNTTQPSVDGYGKVYGEKADAVRRGQATAKLLLGQFDPAWAEQLRLGGQAPFGGDVPADPTVGMLEAGGWVGTPGCTSTELAAIGAGDQIPLPMAKALSALGLTLVERGDFVALWKALGCPVGKDAPPPNGLQARLLALAVGAKAKAKVDALAASA